jgi:hypothetical protein
MLGRGKVTAYRSKYKNYNDHYYESEDGKKFRAAIWDAYNNLQQPEKDIITEKAKALIKTLGTKGMGVHSALELLIKILYFVESESQGKGQCWNGDGRVLDIVLNRLKTH